MELWIRRLVVYGRVQGVGFRPAVCRLSQSLGLSGYVRNLGAVVELVVRGTEPQLELLKQQLENLEKPVLIERILEEVLTEKQYLELCNQYEVEAEAFIAVSSEDVPTESFAPADIAVCQKCLAEMEGLDNRRHNYPYISCAQCGPRYTIMKRLPYDRATTTMNRFKLCPSCRREYKAMENRRGHAETISCGDCGPQLYGFTKESEGRLEQNQALKRAQELLGQGKIILVKAVGGYNLVCRADNSVAVTKLRELKCRPTKPFAVLCGSLQQVEQLCIINDRERELLQAEARPIVLLKKRTGAETLVAEEVATNCPELGIFLPPIGIFKLLSSKPLLVTSCNYSEQPMIFKDEEAYLYFKNNEVVAGIFTYDREILRPADDSVVRVIKLNEAGEQTTQLLRRTRGYMPEPLIMGKKANRVVLSVGADLEPSFGIAQKQRFYGAQIPGKLLELKTEELWQNTEVQWEDFLRLRPELVVGDLHPGYASTQLGQELARKKCINFVQVQHHHAHALSVMAEHGLEEQVLAVCFDGTGYGTNGAIWGGEFLLCQGLNYERVAHLKEVPMLGGDESMKQAWKTSLCYLVAWSKTLDQRCKQILQEVDRRSELVRMALEQGINQINNSSMGRVFDAVASLLGIENYNNHQGACPQALETRARQALEEGISPLNLHFAAIQAANGDICWSTDSLWADLLAVDKKNSLQVKAAALGFHAAVITMVVKTAEALREQKGISKIALAGGCFANRILLEGCLKQLRSKGFLVYFNEKVPVGDGGIALGQAYYGIMMEKTIL